MTARQAAASGTSIKTIQKIESDQILTLHLGTLMRVAAALHLSAVELAPVLGRRPTPRRRAASTLDGYAPPNPPGSQPQ